MQNYKKGDRICLFGFSRGAYTARCLADEHRVRFQPNLWHKEPEDEDATIGARKNDPENATPPQCDDGDIEAGCKGGIGAEIRDNSVAGGGRTKTKTKTDVKEVWFTGCHSGECFSPHFNLAFRN
ncbi:hypothetical protein FRB94_003227 [Tulasnella sp. JGI-2019a]|nr:hypothetical protein FRB94_003227 [Tulasnella sp. JGI-2019a]